MTIKEIINQLTSLKCHCQEMGEAEARNGDSSSNLWFRDVEALDAAINKFNKVPEKNSCEDCEPRDIAEWKQEPYSMVYKCSNCKKTCPGGIKYNFCPNCGAKMESKEEGRTGHLIDRPCEACEYHKETGCSQWSCVFEEVEK